MTGATNYWEDPFKWLGEALADVATFFTDDPIRRLQSAAQDTVTFVEELVSSFSVGDWVLVGLGGVAVYWVIASLKALTSLGPIEVSTLEHDANPKAAVLDLTAALRERLAHARLSPPPAVPAGTPQVNLIAAVEASNIPQSAWLAKLLQLLPKPPRPAQYEISGVLTGEAPKPGSSAKPEPPACGMRFWVRASRDGSTLLDTVVECRDHADAVDRAASLIYLHITNDAVNAFPVWARWTKQRGLDDYLMGCQELRAPHIAAAVERFKAASLSERYNAIAELQLANLYERASAPNDSLERQALSRAQALRKYLTVAHEWPQLVEARYRTSVVSSALATTLEEMRRPNPAQARSVLVYLGDVPQRATDGQVAAAIGPRVERLRHLAARESKAVLQLLKPWYALLRDFRLRTQFEPKAHARRRLRHTVSISKHAVRMRKISGDKRPHRRLEVRYRSAAVHFFHLRLGWGAIDWQAHYNASCFDMLLLDHLRKPWPPQ